MLFVTGFKTIIGLMQEEFKACIKFQGYRVIGIAEI